MMTPGGGTWTQKARSEERKREMASIDIIELKKTAREAIESVWDEENKTTPQK